MVVEQVNRAQRPIRMGLNPYWQIRKGNYINVYRETAYA